MESSFPIAHKRMLRYEGGWSNHPSDPGGVTLEGVIQSVYNDYRRSKGLSTKALTPQMRGTPEWIAERDDIYRSRYWHPPKCGQLDAGVDGAIYDYSVNSGIGRSRKVLQRLVGVKVDGVIGPDTIKAANDRDPVALVNAICDERIAFLRRLKTWPVFGGGWGSRVTDVRIYCTALAKNQTQLQPQPEPGAIPGKGEVPNKTIEKGGAVVAPGGGAVVEGVRDGKGWWDWIQAHPIETAVGVVLIVVAVILIIKGIDAWRKQQQEAPVPGIKPVPVRR